MAAHDFSLDHAEMRDAPKWLRWGMAFINRVGFPIAVCIFLGWLCLFKMEEGKEATNRQTTAIMLLTDAIKDLKSHRGHGR